MIHKLSVILFSTISLVWSKSYNDQLLPPYTNYLSCGKLYYRTVLLDESRNTLYVGAMDKLFKGEHNYFNINCKAWFLI